MDNKLSVITETFLMDASDDDLRTAVRERQEALKGETLLAMEVAVTSRLTFELAFLQAELAHRHPR